MAKPLHCFLVTIKTAEGIRPKVVDERSFTIGRSLDTTICFSDPNISRVHLIISNKNDHVWIEDQGSANGTFVNDNRIEPKKLIAVEPTDIIKFGKTTIELSIGTIEKAFRKEALKESTVIPKDEKESLMALVQGAHAEAQRLVKLAQEQHEQLIKVGEQKAQKIEQAAFEKQGEIIQAGHDKSRQILEDTKARNQQMIRDAEEEARRSVLEIHEQAQKTRQQADEYFKSETERALKNVEDIIDDHRRQGREIVEDARVTAQKLRDDVLTENNQARLQVQKEAEEIIQRGQERAVQIQAEYLEQAKHDTEKRAQDLLAQIRMEAENEKQKLLDEAQAQIRQMMLKKEEVSAEVVKAEQDLLQLKETQELNRKKFEEEMELLRLRKKEELDEFLQRRQEQTENILARKVSEVEESCRHKIEQAKADVENRRAELEKNILDHEKSVQKIKAENDKNIALYEKNIQKMKEDQDRHTVDYEKHIHRLKEDLDKKAEEHDRYIQKRNLELKAIDKNIQEKESLLAQTLRNIEIGEAKINEITPYHKTMKEEMDQYLKNKNSYTEEIRSLENQKGNTALELQQTQEALVSLQKSFEATRAEQKIKLDQEVRELQLQQQKQMDQAKLEQVSLLNKMREDMVEEIYKSKEALSREILNNVESEVVPLTNAAGWMKMHPRLLQKITDTLEEKTAGLSTQDRTQGLDSKTIQKKKRIEKWISLSQGLVAGLALFYIGQFSYQKFVDDSNPMKTAADEEARRRAEDLERRKFNPPQDEELRETYADCVIYTRNFTTSYLDPAFQEKWLKAATTYFLKQWRIEEEKTIEVLSSVNTLVKNLQEKKEAIHPDFIPDGLKKMNELEKETVQKIVETLGSNVKYEAFRKFEKKFYLKESETRGLATESAPAEEENEAP